MDEFQEPTFESDCREFTHQLLKVDTKTLTDDQYALLEHATRIALHAVSSVGGEALQDITVKLTDAVEAFEKGFPLERSQWPTTEDLMDQFNRDLERLDPGTTSVGQDPPTPCQ